MVTTYPVNDYRGYLAHQVMVNPHGWRERSGSKYLRREWTGKGWRYIYDEPREKREAKDYKAEKTEKSKTSGTEKVDRNRGKEITGDYKVSGQVKSFVRPIAGNGAANVAAKAVVGAQNAGKAVANVATGAANAVAGAATDAYHAVEGAIGSSIDWAKNFVEEQAQVYQVDEVKGEIMRDPNDPQKPLYADTIAGNTVRIANEIAEWATQAFSDVKDWIKTATQDVGKWMTARRDELVSKYQEVRGFVNEVAKSLATSTQVQAVLGTIRDGFDAAKNWCITAGTDIAAFVASIPDKASAAFSGIMDFLGVTSQIEDTLNQAQEDALNNQEEQKRGGRGGNF